MESINQKLFLFINGFAHQNTFLDILMISAAKIMPYIFIGLLFYLWFTNKKNEALYAGYAATLGIVVSEIISLFYFHPRPFMENMGITLFKHKADSSFPSDHTTFTVSIAFMLLSFKSTRKIAVIFSILALWCGVARVYSGVHYPFDILGSIVVSIMVVIFINLIRDKLLFVNNFIISIWGRIFKSKS